MDDIREQMDLANELADAISQPVNFGVDFDEEELNEELELLEQEELDAKLLDTGLGANLSAAPSVPTTVPGEYKIDTISRFSEFGACVFE
jgi:charged multivesicular body protein 4